MKSVRKHFLLTVFIFSLIVSFVLFANTINGDFVYDDYYFVPLAELRDPSALIKVWTMPFHPNNPFAGTFRPFAVFTFALNFIFFGESTVSFHLTNILINAINKFLFFVLVLELFKNKKLALLSTIFYLFLPIHVENVAYIKARDDMLGSLFTFASWIFFLKATAKEKLNLKLISLSGVMFFFAVSSKELSILNPAMFFIVYWIKHRPSLINILKTGSIFIPALIFNQILRFIALKGFGGGFTGVLDIFYVANPLKFVDIPTRIWSAFEILYIYMSNIFIPINLSASYHFAHFKPADSLLSAGSIAGLVILIILFVLLFWKKTNKSPIAIGVLIFLIPYIPISQFFFAAGDIIGEKWMYLPSAGISLIVGYLLWKIGKKKERISWIILVFLIFIYSFIIINRNRVWQSEEALFKSVVTGAPKSIQGHVSLGQYYLRKGNVDLAEKEASFAYKIYPDHPPAISLLGSVAFSKKHYSDSEKYYQKALELDPTFARAYLNLASVYFAERKYEDAGKIFAMAIEKSPGRPTPEIVLGYSASQAKLGNYQGCLDALLSRGYVLRKDFGIPGVKMMIAICAYRLGKLNDIQKELGWDTQIYTKEAIEAFEKF